MAKNPFNRTFWFIFTCVWLFLLFISPYSLAQLIDSSLFSILGILGAIFANSTGAGGGVVFIPTFKELNFTDLQSIATSFAIQCFGMTAGAVTWYQHYKTEKKELQLWRGFNAIITVATIASIIGLWLVYGTATQSPSSLHLGFSWFSLLLGSFMMISLFFIKPHRERSKINGIDWCLIASIAFIGGGITAWLSVGVGELIAIYLILRRYDVTMAVAVAVIVSAFTVWSGIMQHTIIKPNVVWLVVLFAGPSAMLGGILAKTIVGYLSARKLKLFFAFWLLVIGFAGLQ